MRAEQQVKLEAALHYEQMGLSSTAARVLAHLMLEPDGTSDAPTLVAELGVAKSSMSAALGVLERFGLIVRRRESGVRRERFVLADNAFEAAFLSKLPALESFVDLADRGLHLVPKGSDAARRLARMRSFYAYMLREFPRLLAGWDPSRD